MSWWFARWLLRRVTFAVPVLWGAATISFVGLHLLPGSLAATIAGGTSAPTPAQIAYVTREYGFDRPLIAQYGSFLWNLVRGDFGQSYQLNLPVLTVIGEQLAASLQLALGAVAIALAVALAVALATAGRPRASAPSRAAELLFLSTPQFWIGILLLAVFSFQLHWFPVIGNQGIRSLVLPWITLALPLASVFTITFREGLERALEQPFALTVLTRGATDWRLRQRHAVRHAILPVLTVSGVALAQLLGGVVVIEEVFARQGIGQVTVTAVEDRDFPVVTGIVVLAALAFVVINSIVDLLYRIIDPRLRAERG